MFPATNNYTKKRNMGYNKIIKNSIQNGKAEFDGGNMIEAFYSSRIICFEVDYECFVNESKGFGSSHHGFSEEIYNEEIDFNLISINALNEDSEIIYFKLSDDTKEIVINFLIQKTA